jgi:hypothetical protein
VAAARRSGTPRYGVVVDRVADAGTAVPDHELEALAMLADPDSPLDPDALPFSVSADETGGLLPDWYMPVASPVRGRVRRTVARGIVVALIVINGAGLCVTSGFVELAW